jgi:predicted transcriptional regulator
METTTKKKPAGTGGSKGQQVLELIREHPDWARKQIADAAGCTVQRVGEVVRAAHAEGIDYVEHLAKGRTRHEDRQAASVAKAVEKAVEKRKAPDVGLSEAENYRDVMARLADGRGESIADASFEAAVAYAKRTKKRAPKRGG